MVRQRMVPRICIKVVLLWAVTLAAHITLASTPPVIYGTTLVDPQGVLKLMFPQTTSFIARELIPIRDGVPTLFQVESKKFFPALDSEFESDNNPYLFYQIEGPHGKLGTVVGVTEKGAQGPLQVFTAINVQGNIQDVYVQKLGSVDLKIFLDKKYREQFRKFSTTSFVDESMVSLAKEQPTKEELLAHHWVVRGVRMNLFLFKYLWGKR